MRSSSRRLRVAVWHNLPSGGGKRALHDHVRGLAERGHEVEVWCPPWADLSYLPLARFAREHVVPWDRPRVGMAGPLGWSLHAHRQTRAELAESDRHARLCAAAIDRGGFDVVFANACQFLFSPDVVRHVSAPSVLYLQEPCRRLYEAEPTESGETRLRWIGAARGPSGPAGPSAWRRALTGRVRDVSEVHALRMKARRELENARACGTLLCNSLFSAESVARSYGLGAKVCYLGIDGEAFAAPDRPKEPFVIGLGSLTYTKGLDRAVRALATVERPRRPRLVWVGNVADDDYLARVVALAVGLGVDFVPRRLVPQGELTDLLGRAAAMVYTSRLEPFGFAPLEANACGTPVVAVAEAGVRESVVDGVNGRLFMADDLNGIGRALREYADDLTAASEAGRRAREHVLARWGLREAVDRLEGHLLDSAGAPSGFRPARQAAGAAV